MKKNNGNCIDRLNFYSNERVITKDFFIEHHLKLTYQRQLISNLEIKHKEWSKYFSYE